MIFALAIFGFGFGFGLVAGFELTVWLFLREADRTHKANK